MSEKQITDRNGKALGERGKRVRQAILDELHRLIDEGDLPWREIGPTEIMRRVREQFRKDPQTAGRLPSAAVFYTHFRSIWGAMAALMADLTAREVPLSDHMKLVIALEAFENGVSDEKINAILEEVLAEGGTSE